MLTPTQKIAVLFGLLAIVMIVLYAVHRFTKKAESDPLIEPDKTVKAMHENLSEVAKERHRKMLAEYHELCDRAIDDNGLSPADEARINELYFELRKVPGFDWRRPR